MIDVDDVRVRRFLVSALELRPARKVRRAVGMGTPGDGKAVSAKLAELNRNAGWNLESCRVHPTTSQDKEVPSSTRIAL